MRKFLFLLFIFNFSIKVASQTSEIDSLLSLFSQLEKKDTAYVDVANEIAFRYSFTDQQQSIYYINLALSKAKELGYERGLFRATTIKGSSYLIIGLPDQALTYYLEALTYNMDGYPMEYVRLYNNIGEVYRRKKVYDSSIVYFNRALSIVEEHLEDYLPVIILSNLGEVSLTQGKVDKAKTYFEQAIKNAVASNHLRGIGYGYYGLSECEFLSGNYSEAIDLQRLSIKHRKIANHKRGLIQSYLRLGNHFSTTLINEPDSALYYWKKAEILAIENDANDLLDQVFNELYQYYLKIGQINQAAFFMEKHKNLSDSIRNSEFISNVDKLKTALQSELIIAENQLLKQKQAQLKAEEDARLTVLILAFFIVVGLVIATYQYRKRQKTIYEAAAESSFTKTLLSLSRELNDVHLNFDSFMKELLTLSRDAIECDRATYWTIDQSNGELYLHSISQKKNVSEIPAIRFKPDQLPVFFNDFLANRTVAINQVSRDSRLQDIYERYFKSAKIESVLNAPILIDSQFLGFISYSMTENKLREWDIQEQRYVGSLADLIVSAISKIKANQLESEKEELIKKLLLRNKSLEEFNSVISHNLREPLTQIIGFSEVLQNGPKNDPVVVTEIIERISNASNRIDKVIKELSTVLNESDPKPSDFKELSLDKLLDEVLDLLKNEIPDGLKLNKNLEIKTIHTYKPFLSDILYHLLSNSLKFSDPTRALKINIRSYEDNSHVCIEVIDNSRGINLDKFKGKMFKMYQRYHLDVEGRGVGLFIVKNRTESLNGKIAVKSEEGVGTTFTIQFPEKIH